jgi:hypothetical protein
MRQNSEVQKFESEIQASIVYLHKFSQPGEYYMIRGTPSITQLLYDTGPAEYMASLDVYKQAAGKDATDKPKPDLVWIHLPANNMSWVEVIANTSLLRGNAVLTWKRHL